MKILITGGAGFIGSHLVEKLLKKKHKITVIDNLSTGRLENLKPFIKKIKFVKKDLSKSQILQYFKNIEVVFHLAALADIVPSINSPKKYFEANVTSTLNVLEASAKNKVKKFVYSASSSCYGIPRKYPTTEVEKIDTKYPYALTKKQGEDLVLHWGNVYNLNVTSLRLFNVYGTRSRTSGTYGAMFGTFLKQKLKDYPFTIVGNGRQKRDFTYVSDVVEAFIKCIKYKKNCQVFNVGSGNTHSVNKICSLLGGKKQSIPVRPGEPKITFADIKKISKELKWKPKIKIEQGVNLVLKNINYWDKAPLWTKKRIKIATKDWFKYIKD